MEFRTGLNQHRVGAGFTLVELLLAVALLVLLLSAVIFNFSSLQQGAALDEGVNQLEALIRFARAHAASTGKQVQITFEEEAGSGQATPLGILKVLWEPDPVSRPGFFEPLTELQEYVRRITELISIESVRLTETEYIAPERTAMLENTDEGSETNSMFVTFPSIGFFPDGSCDSAEIKVGSRSQEDTRRIAVRVQGINGSIRHHLITDELKVEEQEPAQQPVEPATTTNANLLTEPSRTRLSNE